MSVARDRHQSLRSEQLEREAERQLKLLAEAKAVAGPESHDSTPTTTDTLARANQEVEA
ncbi:hypothetical protein [Natrinema halophilum]|uniref:Uncharacterized protein n=1 Tax=Natrinema halophilum TaxID=1699371 RepID=A0A7D5KJA3_9EURY|nr:hypothetical protein [Natrinema halophilum]QLG47838.1 hypothetical protein HYG82_02760 [Natrinema halophilum]